MLLIFDGVDCKSFMRVCIQQRDSRNKKEGHCAFQELVHPLKIVAPHSYSHFIFLRQSKQEYSENDIQTRGKFSKDMNIETNFYFTQQYALADYLTR